MDLLDYKEYVYAVFQERSFSKAAQKLYVSQPWLSATVKKVEREIKLPLFDRSTAPVGVTEAGRYYVEQIEKIMKIEREMEAYFARMSLTSGEVLRIGSSMFFCTYVLPSLVEDFKILHPDVMIRLVEGNSCPLAEKLLTGQLDFLIEVEQPRHKGIQTIPWAVEEMILAVPAGYEINRELSEYRYTFDEFLTRGRDRKPPVPLSAFRDESFLILNSENDSYGRSLEICSNAGFTPHISLLLTQMMTAYYLVCEGRGIAFLRSMIPCSVSPTESVVFYLLDDPLATRTIYLSCPTQTTDPIRKSLLAFMESKETLDKIKKPWGER